MSGNSEKEMGATIKRGAIIRDNTVHMLINGDLVYCNLLMYTIAS